MQNKFKFLLNKLKFLPTKLNISRKAVSVYVSLAFKSHSPVGQCVDSPYMNLHYAVIMYIYCICYTHAAPKHHFGFATKLN